MRIDPNNKTEGWWDARTTYTPVCPDGFSMRLFAGLNRLVKYGVKPDHIMVYMLVGYWPGETHDDRDYRRGRLREFGARPYPMPYVRSRELVGFQRWVIGALWPVLLIAQKPPYPLYLGSDFARISLFLQA